MRLNINTTQKKVYRQIVEVMRSIPPLDMLRNRDLEVLAILMYYNFKYRTVEETIRWRIINSSSTKKEMQDAISMSEDIFNNNMSHIRKAGLLDKDNKLPSFLQIIISDKYEVKFNFNIQENE
jgi:hypothetical protein